MRVARLGAPVLHVDVARDVLHGPRPVERDHRRQLADVTRLQLLHPAPHPPTLELEHTEGAPLGEQLGRRLVAVGDRLEVEPARDQLGRLTEDRQVRQPEEVELQQPDPRDVVHVELRRRQRLRVFVLARRRPLQRHQVGQRLARDHHARRVRARVPRHALQAARRLDQLAHLRIVVARRPQLFDLVQRLIERHPQHVRHQPRHPVDVAVAHPQRAPRVADRGLRPERPEGHDLRDPIPPVALRRVADHLLAAVVREVEVHVRHLAPLGVQEPLEHQPVLRWLDVRDVDAVQHHRGRRGPPQAHRDAVRARVLRDVAHDQDVLDEPRLLDHRQFVAQPLALLLAGIGIALGQPPLAQRAQVLGRRQPLGDARVRQQRPPEVEPNVDLLRDPRGVVARLRQLRQQRPHLLLGLDVERAALELQPVRLVHRRVRADAQQHVVRVLLLGRGVVRVVGQHQRQLELPRQLHQPGVVPRELLLPVVLQLHVVAPRERVAVPPERRARGVRRATPAAPSAPRPTGMPRARSVPRRVPPAARDRPAAGSRTPRGATPTKAAAGCGTRSRSAPAAVRWYGVRSAGLRSSRLFGATYASSPMIGFSALARASS